MKNTIILFDLDGTLIDSTDAIISTFHHTFTEMNFNFTGNNEDIKSLIGYPLEIMYTKLGVKETLALEFVNSYKKKYRLISKEQTSLLKGAKEALTLAKSFARLSVVTTKTGSLTIPLLEHLGIMHYFEHLTGRENVQNPKPHSEPILRTISLMNANNNSNIWMVGDTTLDLISANSANIHCVGVLCGYGKEKDLKEFTKYITPNALEAVRLISQSQL